MALCCLVLFSGCDKDDSSAEVEQLEKELIAEKGKTVVDLRKEGDNLVIVYSNGTTSTVPYTEAMKGNIGAAQDGVGIKNITYNGETGILTITLTNGEVSEFKITTTDMEWDAVLVGDTNGSLFITEALLGSVPVIKAEYNDAFQLTYLESNKAVDMQIRKDFDLTKAYKGDALETYTLRTYSLEEKVNHSYEYVPGMEPVETVFIEHKGNYFKTSNGDGTYTIYRYHSSKWENNAEKFVYQKLATKAIVISSGEQEYYYSEIMRKKSDSEYYYYRQVSNWYAENERAYVLSEIIKVGSKNPAGTLLSTKVVNVETDAQGRVTKAYEAQGEGEQATRYMSYEYNAAGLVKTTKVFVKNTKGAWVASGEFETYTYNLDNRLASIVRTFADGTTQQVQKANYDKNGNPTEIWAWQPAEREYRWRSNPATGSWYGYVETIREAGLYKVATIEYDYAFKNFFGNTVTALVPELEGYKVVNAIKRATVPNSYSFAHVEYKDFNEHGYPRRMVMNASGDVGDFDNAAHLEVVLNYKVKSK